MTSICGVEPRSQEGLLGPMVTQVTERVITLGEDWKE